VVTRPPLAERVLAVVAAVAGPSRTPPHPAPDTPLGEDGFWLDSVDLMEVVVACEKEFGVIFEGETDLTREAMRTAGTLAALIESKQAR
jgi:acyl carrier protein